MSAAGNRLIADYIPDDLVVATENVRDTITGAERLDACRVELVVHAIHDRKQEVRRAVHVDELRAMADAHQIVRALELVGFSRADLLDMAGAGGAR